MSRSMFKDKDKMQDLGTVMLCSTAEMGGGGGEGLTNGLRACISCNIQHTDGTGVHSSGWAGWCHLKSAKFSGIWWYKLYFWVRQCRYLSMAAFLAVWTGCSPLSPSREVNE